MHDVPRSWTLLALVALIACSGGAPQSSPPTPLPPTEPTPTPPATPPAVCAEPLTIEWINETGGPPLSNGDAVTMAHGPQGGWHIAIQARIRGAAEDSVRGHAVVEVVSTGEQLAGDDNTFPLAMFDWEAATCTGTMSGMLAYLDDPPDIDQSRICELEGQQLRLFLDVEDAAGTVTELEVVVVASTDPGDDCT